MLRDRVTALRTANIYERQSYRHIVGLPVLGETGADSIAAETPFLVVRIMRDGRTDLFGPASISTGSARRETIRASRNGSSSATAVISTRCSPSPSRLRRRRQLLQKFGGLDRTFPSFERKLLI